MPTCKQCGGEATNKLMPDLCMPCLEKAMDALTGDDIAMAMEDLAFHGSSVQTVSADGTVSRVDPLEFFKHDDNP